jgi:putative transcriptional regulator
MKPKARHRTRSTTNAAGRELMASIREALHAAQSGDMTGITIREVEIPDPGEYGAKQVKALRESMGVSQRVFGEMTGVSKELVAQWEYGIRHPSRLARRLLDRIKDDPAAYLSALMKRRVVGARYGN